MVQGEGERAAAFPLTFFQGKIFEGKARLEGQVRERGPPAGAVEVRHLKLPAINPQRVDEEFESRR